MGNGTGPTAGAAAAVMLWAMAAAGAQAAEIAWSPHSYKLASGEVIEAEMGTLEVPAHRDRPGAKIALKLVRLRSFGGRSGSPIVYLAGGPGGSAIEVGKGERWKLFDALRREGDVILLDQRGAGHSSPPPPCSTPWTFPLDQASTEATVNASLEAAAAKCAIEWRGKGVDLSAYNTAENAADVAEVARALGGRVRLVAISYGTFLAFAVLRDHAQVVERVVLAGTEGPDHTVKLPTQADRVLAELSRRAAADPKARALTPDLERSFRNVITRLKAQPAWGEAKGPSGETVRVLISAYDVQAAIAFMMATSANATRVPPLVAAMEAGDFGPMAATVLFMRRFLAPLPAMPLAMDAASPTSPERLRRVRTESARSAFGNAVNAPSADFAGALSVKTLPQRWRMPLRTEVPALFISGDLDSRTPPVNAEEVRKGFRRSGHLVLKGAGHDNDLFLSSPLILARIDAFLRGQPARDEQIEVEALRF
jgi:pimeloyl-ACP methyl ester carboxylesterase